MQLCYILLLRFIWLFLKKSFGVRFIKRKRVAASNRKWSQLECFLKCSFNRLCAVASPLHLNPIKGKETRKVTAAALRALQLYRRIPQNTVVRFFRIQHWRVPLLCSWLKRPSTRCSYSAVATDQFLNLFAKMPLTYTCLIIIILVLMMIYSRGGRWGRRNGEGRAMV